MEGNVYSVIVACVDDDASAVVIVVCMIRVVEDTTAVVRVVVPRVVGASEVVEGYEGTITTVGIGAAGTWVGEQGPMHEML